MHFSWLPFKPMPMASITSHWWSPGPADKFSGPATAAALFSLNATAWRWRFLQAPHSHAYRRNFSASLPSAAGRLPWSLRLISDGLPDAARFCDIRS